MISRPRNMGRIPVSREYTTDPLAMLRVSDTLNQVAMKLGDIGMVVRPGQSIERAIINLGVDGGRILLSEGTYPIEATITVDRPNVSIVAMSPHRTLIKRTITTSSPLIQATSDYVMISGIRFDDANATGAAVKITGNYGSVSGCRFDDVYKAVEITGSWCRVSDNLVIASDSYPVHLTSSSANTQVTGNRIVPVTAFAVYVEGSTPKAVITGNVFDMTDGNGTASYSSAGSAENYVARGNAAGAEDASNIAAAYNRRP
tara:strand:+ start:2955 stop:3731 length:777 start_codon:yes stop_codon:yes gene_type:complete